MIEWLMEIEHPLLLAVLAFACFPLYRAWALLLFGSTQRLRIAVQWLHARDVKSLMNGDYVEDKLAEIKLGALLLISLLTLSAAYTGVVRIWGWFGG